ncbi:uncharacterized protein LOC114530238 [Dendronephthya gigantea]|uniref:uncharacterized protein LOC114530238 n=1 Tax=Dendronephthya gigantea TaxID=151771 RepID=UPI0010693A90|nr:uncharacterized protein LOC114530238 [Dendronephthya gigantea]
MLLKQLITLVVIFICLEQCFGRRLKVKGLKTDTKSDGRGIIHRVCPSKVKLNCANVMYSKTCNGNYDCSYAGPQFVCCETGCTGDSKFVCVPEENSKCPYLQPITFTGLRKCNVGNDCEKGFTCCFDIAGKGYCHKPTQEEMMETY